MYGTLAQKEHLSPCAFELAEEEREHERAKKEKEKEAAAGRPGSAGSSVHSASSGSGTASGGGDSGGGDSSEGDGSGSDPDSARFGARGPAGQALELMRKLPVIAMPPPPALRVPPGKAASAVAALAGAGAGDDAEAKRAQGSDGGAAPEKQDGGAVSPRGGGGAISPRVSAAAAATARPPAGPALSPRGGLTAQLSLSPRRPCEPELPAAQPDRRAQSLDIPRKMCPQPPSDPLESSGARRAPRASVHLGLYSPKDPAPGDGGGGAVWARRASIGGGAPMPLLGGGGGGGPLPRVSFYAPEAPFGDSSGGDLSPTSAFLGRPPPAPHRRVQPSKAKSGGFVATLRGVVHGGGDDDEDAGFGFGGFGGETPRDRRRSSGGGNIRGPSGGEGYDDMVDVLAQGPAQPPPVVAAKREVRSLDGGSRSFAAARAAMAAQFSPRESNVPEGGESGEGGEQRPAHPLRRRRNSINGKISDLAGGVGAGLAADNGRSLPLAATTAANNELHLPPIAPPRSSVAAAAAPGAASPPAPTPPADKGAPPKPARRGLGGLVAGALQSVGFGARRGAAA